jgi:flagellar motor switch protein FliG
MAEVIKKPDLSREEKVAILISSLGENLARQILENMNPARAQDLEDRLAALGPLDRETVERVVGEFVRFVVKRDNHAPVPGGKEKSSGEDKDVEGEEGEKSLSSVLEHMEANVLADFTKSEHPQTIALILAHLEASKAGEVLSILPEELQADVVFRLAHLETVSSSAVKAVAEALEDQVQSVGAVEKRIGGVKMVAEIINQTGRSQEKTILARIEEADPELSDQIRQELFTFDDLVKVDDRGIREILKEITSESLSLALKAASDEIKEKIFKNMSKRAAEMLREDIETLGPARLSDVEKAQQIISRAAMKLEGEGKIVVGGRGREEILV